MSHAARLYRAGYRNARQYFDSLDDAARYVAENGGPIDRLAGSLYRTMTSAAKAEAIARLTNLREKDNA